MKKNYSFALMTVFIWATGATLLKFLFNDIPNFEALSISSAFSFLFLLISNIIRGNMHLLKEYFPTNIGKLLVLNFGGLFLHYTQRTIKCSKTAFDPLCLCRCCHFVFGKKCSCRNRPSIRSGMLWMGLVVNAIS